MTHGFDITPAIWLTQPWRTMDQPLIIIDLDQTDPHTSLAALPPVPVLGIGKEAHPLAAQLDMVFAAPEEARKIIANIHRFPAPAAMLVQLLRQVEIMEIQPALMMESLSFAVLQGSRDHQNWLNQRRPSPAYAAGEVRAERQDDRLHICLDRPHAFNQINQPMRDQLREYLELGALDADIRHIHLTGLGRSFCAGAELSEFGTTRDPMTAHHIRLLTLPAHILAVCAPKLSVHIQGACIGSGLEMAAFAHHISAAPNAWFQLPELSMGLIPGAGGCVSISRRIGRQNAAALILSGQRLSARAALQCGLIDTLIEDIPADHRQTDSVGG